MSWWNKPRPIKDYIYVSRLKAERLSTNLSPKLLNRLKTVDVKVGPVGAAITLSDAPNPHVIKVAEAVDEMIREAHTVHRLTDDGIKAGQYIGGTYQMVYGVQKARGSMDSDAAVFVGELDRNMVFLVGSAAHMLDRHVTIDVESGMSAPEAVYDILATVPEGDDAPDGGNLTRNRDDVWSPTGYPITSLYAELVRGGTFLLSFLAKVHKVVNIADPEAEMFDFETNEWVPSTSAIRYVIGSPLWVTSDVPE